MSSTNMRRAIEISLTRLCRPQLQVAFMFLTRGVLYHEATWQVWFRGVAGLLPAAALQLAGCDPGLLEHLRHSCGAKAGARLLQQQHLFSVYAHVGANEASWTGARSACLLTQDAMRTASQRLPQAQ